MTRKPFEIITERLLLREFAEQDAVELFRLNSDPEVLRYTGDQPFTDSDAAAHFIREYPDYERTRFGRWAVIGRESGKFLGFCGLKRSARTHEVDLGYRFFPEYWARGIATEAARACLETGFDQFGLDEITGRCMRENLPSITILRKLGMTFRDIVEEDGRYWLVYAISADEYRSRSGR